MLSKKQIATKISAIRRADKTQRERIQVVLVQLAGHVYEHGDVTLFNTLWDAAPGSNQKALAKFAKEHCFAELQKDGKFHLMKTARKNADFENGEAVVAYLEKNAGNWWDLGDSAGTISRALDVAGRLDAIAKQISNHGERKVVVDIQAIEAAYGNVIKAARLAAQERPKAV